MMLAGIVMLVLMLVPGMPKLQMIIVGVGLVAGGMLLSRRKDGSGDA